jgi:hypothetical protein
MNLPPFDDGEAHVPVDWHARKQMDGVPHTIFNARD